MRHVVAISNAILVGVARRHAIAAVIEDPAHNPGLQAGHLLLLWHLKSLSDGRVVFVHQEAQQFGTFPFPDFTNKPTCSFRHPNIRVSGAHTAWMAMPPLEPDGKTAAPPSRYSYTTNGVANPTLQMQPGEVQRWRLLNATDGDNLQLVLVSSVDARNSKVSGSTSSRWTGLRCRKPTASQPGDPLVIGPGQRMDVMVKAPSTPGTYLLQAVDNNSGEIKASVSPYRDSNFPNGIDPAGQTVPAQF